MKAGVIDVVDFVARRHGGRCSIGYPGARPGGIGGDRTDSARPAGWSAPR
jgi:hypothetical protein